MAWVESVSPSFRARHDSAQADDAAWVLESLERTRDELAVIFPREVADITVVLHKDSFSLSMSNPTLPLRWLLTAPANRRYVAGWASGEELHVLSPSALDARASNVPGSREMLSLTAPALYARRVIAENNRDLPTGLTPGRVRAELRWAWLLEGAGRWFSGQSDHARPAIARRLREGGRPSFPPGLRDAPLLGASVIDLLARQEGERAAAQFVTRLDPQGARAALQKAFNNKPLVHIEGDWRSHLARLASTPR
jgi:hypothetical protein